MSEFMEVYQRSPKEYPQAMQYLLRREQGEVARRGPEDYIGVPIEELAGDFSGAATLKTAGWEAAYYKGEVISYGQGAVEGFIYGWSSEDYVESHDRQIVANVRAAAEDAANAEVGFSSSLVLSQPLASVVQAERFTGLEAATVSIGNIPYIFALANDHGETLATYGFYEDDIVFRLEKYPEGTTDADMEGLTIQDSSLLEDHEREALQVLRNALDSHFVDRLQTHEVL